MGNAPLCIGRSPTGQVIRPDGSIEEFQCPVQVEKLVSLYPDYLVVHWSDANLSLEERCQNSIMDPKDSLVPGQSYILYPAPSQFQQRSQPSSWPLQMSGPLSTSSAKNSQSSETKRKIASGRWQKSLPIKALARCLTQLLFARKEQPSERALIKQASAAVPLLYSSQKEDSAISIEEKNEQILRKKLILSLEPYLWRPSLDCIPESPSGQDDTLKFPLEFQQSESVPSSLRLQSATPPPIPMGLGLAGTIITSSSSIDFSEGFPISQSGQAFTDIDAGFYHFPDQDCGFQDLESRPLL